MKTNIGFWSFLAQFFLEWDMFQTKVVEKIKTRILCLTTFFCSPRKSCRVWDNVEKCCKAWQATDDNMARAHWTLYTKRYRHTLRICSFPLQQCLHESGSILRYTYVACVLLMENAFVYLAVRTERRITHASLPLRIVRTMRHMHLRRFQTTDDSVYRLTQLSTDELKCRATAP